MQNSRGGGFKVICFASPLTIMIKFIKIGKYEVRIEKRGNEVKLNCTCMWGSLHPENWEEGSIVCKHIKEAIKKIK